mmetsp:Transcript_64462/g.151860  ORF Transcript_64462/g.151860 Transcript_64462/m.151860 type:complete len:203 (+) Transcript_64462:945-1553(+)
MIAPARASGVCGSLLSAWRLATSWRCLSSNFWTGVTDLGVRRRRKLRGRISLGSMRQSETSVPTGPCTALVKPRSTASVPVRSVPSAEITMSPRLTSPDASAELSGATSETRKKPAPDPTSTMTEIPTSPSKSALRMVPSGVTSSTWTDGSWVAPSSSWSVNGTHSELSRTLTPLEEALKRLCPLLLVALECCDGMCVVAFE